ncbi:MAG: hypothetical protein ABI573_06300 [Chloroflexota bacterium]
MSPLRPLAAATLAISLLGCGDRPSPPASSNPAFDPAAPTVVTGRFLNSASLPAIGAIVDLQVWDDANAEIGKPVPLVLDLQVLTSLDGRFEFRFRPAPDLRTFAHTNNDYVNFQLMGIDANSQGIGQWAFPRKIVGDAWEEPVPSVTLHENGAGTEP